MDLLHSILFWEFAAFILFLLIAIRFGWKRVVGGLDARADAIREELDEARKLREEAQGVLADYQRKKRDAEKEAQEIVEHAKQEAETLKVEAEKKLEESLARRTRLAEEKIERAEAQAVQEVRNTAIDVAVAAAQKMIADNVDEARAKTLIDDAIAEVQKNIH